MAPADGNDNPPELIYGLHAVREALRAGIRPLQRLLVLGTDRQFGEIVRLAESLSVSLCISNHAPPSIGLSRLVVIKESSDW